MRQGLTVLAALYQAGARHGREGLTQGPRGAVSPGQGRPALPSHPVPRPPASGALFPTQAQTVPVWPALWRGGHVGWCPQPSPGGPSPSSWGH